MSKTNSNKPSKLPLILAGIALILAGIAIGVAGQTAANQTEAQHTHPYVPADEEDLKTQQEAIELQGETIDTERLNQIALWEFFADLNATTWKHQDEILKNRDLIADTQYGDSPSVPSSDSPSVNEINIQYDQSTYELGDVVRISGSGQPEGFVIVDVKLPNEIEREVNGYIDSRGNFNVHIIIKSDDPLGQWTVKIRDSAGQRTNSAFLVE